MGRLTAPRRAFFLQQRTIKVHFFWILIRKKTKSRGGGDRFGVLIPPPKIMIIPEQPLSP